MRIALINENSQASKNAIVEEALKKVGLLDFEKPFLHNV